MVNAQLIERYGPVFVPPEAGGTCRLCGSERYRHAHAGSWSRRIGEEHRLVYLVEGDNIVILQARYRHR